MGKKNGKAKPAAKDLEPRTDNEVKGGGSVSSTLDNIFKAATTAAQKVG